MRLPLLLREWSLGAVSPALIVYLDLFFAQVHLDDFLVPGDPLAQPDLLLEHNALGDHDLLLEDLHHHLVPADIRLGGSAGLPGLALYRHPVDVYLLAPPRNPHHLALRSHALLDVHPAGLLLADAGAEFLLRALHPQVFLEDTALVGDRPHRVLWQMFIASLVSQNGPFWAGSLCCERPKQQSKEDTPHKRTCPLKKVCPYSPVPRSVLSSTSTSSRLTSSSTTSVSSTTSLRTRISSLATARLSTTTSSSVTGTDTSSSPIWASVASPLTGTRSTLTSSCLVGTSMRSRSVLTRFLTFMAPASRSRVPATSSSSLLCTLSSSSSSRSEVVPASECSAS